MGMEKTSRLEAIFAEADVCFKKFTFDRDKHKNRASFWRIAERGLLAGVVVVSAFGVYGDDNHSLYEYTKYSNLVAIIMTVLAGIVDCWRDQMRFRDLWYVEAWACLEMERLIHDLRTIIKSGAGDNKTEDDFRSWFDWILLSRIQKMAQIRSEEEASRLRGVTDGSTSSLPNWTSNS